MIEIVGATRLSEHAFWNESALGISLRRLGSDGRLVPRIAFQNRRGLPQIYNEGLSTEDGSDIIAFIMTTSGLTTTSLRTG